MRTCTLLLLTAAVAAATTAADDWTPIGSSISSRHFQKFGQWVAEELGPPIRFYRVVSGKRQNANGINYKFIVAMGNHEGDMDNYEVEVHATVARPAGLQ